MNHNARYRIPPRLACEDFTGRVVEKLSLEGESAKPGKTEARASRCWPVCAVPLDAETAIGPRLDFLYVPTFGDGPEFPKVSAPACAALRRVWTGDSDRSL